MIEIRFSKTNNKSIAYDNNIKIGECEFIETEESWNIIHTEVDRLYQGQGIARKLVENIIENAKKYNKKLIAECSYAKRVIEKISQGEKMKVKKAGTILIDLSNKKIGLVYRSDKDDYSFPKGHLEPGESIQECAVRETEEETGRLNHLMSNKEITILEYITPSGEDVEVYFYIAIDEGESKKEVPLELKENLFWVSPEEVKEKLTYKNLKEVWAKVENIINDILKGATL